MRTYKRIASVKTTLDILGFLSDQEGPVPGSEIARALDLPPGTVMSHLATQEDASFVRRVGDGYELGPLLATMWAQYRKRLQSKIEKMNEELGRTDRTERPETVAPALNPGTLRKVIEGIEEGLAVRQLELTPGKKAELISLLYEHFLGTDNEVNS